MNYERELFDYGIHNEASNIRAHVAPASTTLFVFPTICAVQIMKNYPKVPAFQQGVEGATAVGYLVPPKAIPYIRCLQIGTNRLDGFVPNLSTTEKGDRAVKVVNDFLMGGRFPLWLEGAFVTDKEIQITGTDIVVQGKWKIEVKCDYWASTEKGEPIAGCTGNLYLQILERNPLKKH